MHLHTREISVLVDSSHQWIQFCFPPEYVRQISRFWHYFGEIQAAMKGERKTRKCSDANRVKFAELENGNLINWIPGITLGFPIEIWVIETFTRFPKKFAGIKMFLHKQQFLVTLLKTPLKCKNLRSCWSFNHQNEAKHSQTQTNFDVFASKDSNWCFIDSHRIPTAKPTYQGAFYFLSISTNQLLHYANLLATFSGLCCVLISTYDEGRSSMSEM